MKEYQIFLAKFIDSKHEKVKKLVALFRPLNEQKKRYDESLEEEHHLKLCTGEKIALQTITKDILKRFVMMMTAMLH